MVKFETFETRKGVISKLFILGSISIGIFVFGKRHIAVNKENRHIRESDARIDSDTAEFQAKPLKPGNPLQETAQRESKYVGAGGAYASRKKGDKFTMFNIFDRD